MRRRLGKALLKNSFLAAKTISEQTQKPIWFHFIDAISCYFIHGCEVEQYASGGFYRLRAFERKNTYTKGRGYTAKSIFNSSKNVCILADKEKFNDYFSPYVKRKWISCKQANVYDLKMFVKDCKKVLVKPIGGMKGQGIHILSVEEKNDLDLLVGRNILLEEYIEQHPLLVFNNQSVNTIRIITLLDKNGVVQCLKAALRCGVGDSVVDNMSTGGVAYPINIEYGCIEGPGLLGSYSIGNKELIFVHPGTDIFMLGYKIPFWREIIEAVVDAANKLQDVRFIGWDVAVTPDGPELIEGNSRPGPATFEYLGIERGFYSKIMKCI